MSRDTPIPDLRRPEWFDRLRRSIAHHTHPKRRRRSAKRVVMFLLSLAAAGMFKEAWHLAALRLQWEPPPGRSGERLGVDRIERITRRNAQ